MLCPESEDVEGNESQDKESEPTGESVDLAHPWPYLKEMFAIKSMNGTNVKLTCLLCAPMYKECCASLSSLSNLRTHVKVGKNTISTQL